jgi:hypothetical protein
MLTLKLAHRSVRALAKDAIYGQIHSGRDQGPLQGANIVASHWRGHQAERRHTPDSAE